MVTPSLPLPQGYDMEDAMILNKASSERGFAHATVYKSEVGGAGGQGGRWGRWVNRWVGQVGVAALIM